MRKKVLISILFACFVISMTAVPNSSAAEPGVEKNWANPDVLVSTEWVSNNLDDIELIDCSGDGLYATQGHIEGAYSAATPETAEGWNWIGKFLNHTESTPYQIADKSQVEEVLGKMGITTDDTVVIYDMANDVFAAKVFWILRFYGFPLSNLKLMDGGLPKWIAENRPLSTSVPLEQDVECDLPGYGNDYIRASWEEVYRNLGRENYQVVDARGSGEWSGENVYQSSGKELMEPRQGHIPGAVNVNAFAALTEAGTFKSRENLEQIYSGVDNSNIIYTHCEGGGRGAFSWFVLTYGLGYPEVQMFDGSMAAWGSRPFLPLVNETWRGGVEPYAFSRPEMEARHQTIETRVTDVESDISFIESDVGDLEDRVAALEEDGDAEALPNWVKYVSIAAIIVALIGIIVAATAHRK